MDDDDRINAADGDEAQESKEELKLRLKAAVFYEVTKVLEEECQAAGDWEWTKAFQTSMTDIAFEFATKLGKDLESFCKHAGRKVVKPDDVLLAARRNPELRRRLADQWKELADETEQKKATKSTSTKKRKAVAEPDDDGGADDDDHPAPKKKTPSTKRAKKNDETSEVATTSTSTKKKTTATATSKTSASKSSSSKKASKVDMNDIDAFDEPIIHDDDDFE